MENNNWSFSQVWNKSLEEREERLLMPRDYLWASELGKSAIDVWLRLKGTKPTNPVLMMSSFSFPFTGAPTLTLTFSMGRPERKTN